MLKAGEFLGTRIVKKLEAETGTAFLRYNENFTLGRDFYVTYFCNTGNA